MCSEPQATKSVSDTMSHLLLKQYLKGHDQTYPKHYTPQIEANALELLGRVNPFCAYVMEHHPEVDLHPSANSGWRPTPYNNLVRGKKGSRHITAEAIDLNDTDKKLAKCLLENDYLLEKFDLYMEHPLYTPGWVHVQTVKPASGARIFFP